VPRARSRDPSRSRHRRFKGSLGIFVSVDPRLPSSRGSNERGRTRERCISRILDAFQGRYNPRLDGGASAERAPEIGGQSRASMQREGGVAIGLACRGSSSNILEFLLEFISGSLSSGTRGRGIDGTSGPADAPRSRPHEPAVIPQRGMRRRLLLDNTFLRCAAWRGAGKAT